MTATRNVNIDKVYAVMPQTYPHTHTQIHSIFNVAHFMFSISGLVRERANQYADDR